MQVVTHIGELEPFRGGVLVPTMGALHAGHVALIRHAAGVGAPVIVSIFVNPTQFAPGEDLDTYPHDLDGDLARAEGAGADVAFAPSVRTMYPPDADVAAPPLPAVATEPGLEDACRPGHFAGVCQVVARLFDLVRPARAVFGEKDYQQLQVIRAMVAAEGARWPDLAIVAHPTVREPDGLAMSSRNVRLTAEQRKRALGLSRALRAAPSGASPHESEQLMRDVLHRHDLDVEYAVVRDAATLRRVSGRNVASRALIAARLGDVRLIDNCRDGVFCMRANAIERTGLILFVVATLSGCFVERVPSSGPSAPLNEAPLAESDWPLRAENPATFFVKSGQEHLQLIDHGVFGEGRITEVIQLSPKKHLFDWTRRRSKIGIDELDNILSHSYEPRSPEDGDRDVSSYVFSSHEMIHFHRPVEETVTHRDPDRIPARWAVPALTFMAHGVSESVPPRGTILLLAGLDGASRGDRELHDEFTRRGWLVLWISAEFDPLNKWPLPGVEAGVHEVATSAAIRVDSRLAERAYAARAFLEFARERWRQHLRGPLVVIGASAGAVDLPTVVAGVPGEVDAAVIIAGGADLFGIGIDSTLDLVTWHGPRPSDEDMAIVRATVLEESKLDPCHTAAFLRGTPVLMLHARRDRIVPAKYGDLLWERLGRPERWTYSTGHIGLFLWLPTQVQAIADWIDEAVATPRQLITDN